jgi:hypothetical protein
LFLICLGAFAYFYQAGSWNSTTRFDLVRAIVERHTLSIDAYHMNTGDKALRDGRYYCDKAPGISLLCAPSYAVVHLIDGEHQEMDHLQTLGSYLCVLSTVALPSAFAVATFFLLLRAGSGSATRGRCCSRAATPSRPWPGPTPRSTTDTRPPPPGC